MKFYEVKEKIERVIDSCETRIQRCYGSKYCYTLINKYISDIWDRQDMEIYLGKLKEINRKKLSKSLV